MLITVQAEERPSRSLFFLCKRKPAAILIDEGIQNTNFENNITLKKHLGYVLKSIILNMKNNILSLPVNGIAEYSEGIGGL